MGLVVSNNGYVMHYLCILMATYVCTHVIYVHDILCINVNIGVANPQLKYGHG